MLRSNLIGTFLAAATLGSGPALAEPAWADLDLPAITLLDPGAEPREVLRYSVPTGAEQSVRRVQGYEIAAQLPLGGGQTDEGEVAMRFRLRSMVPTGSAPIELRADLDELTGPRDSGEGLVAGGTVRYDARGRALQARWDQTPASADMNAVMLQRFQVRVLGLATPLPEEALGVGGRWRVRQPVEQGGGRFVMVADCTLISFTARGLDVECRFSHETDGATFTVGSGKRSRDVSLEDSSVDGRSLLLQSLDRLAPLREDGDLHTFIAARTKMGLMRVKIKVDTAERWNQVGAD